MNRRKTSVLAMVLMLVVSMTVNTFAVSGAADSDSTDYNTNRTGNNTSVRQSNSSDTGTIRLGKILTVKQSGKFPNIEDFIFKITPVAAWDNVNKSTAKSGAVIPVGSMPKPAASGAAHHSIAVTGSAPWTCLVTIGNFRDAKEGNTSGIYGDRKHKYVNSDNASNISGIDENKRRTRVTDVSFRFSKAGYYVYRIEEAGSKPNGGTGSPEELRKDVAGVDYDDNTYYVVFYVCNREAAADSDTAAVQKGDTVDGVYVHTITSWTNQPASEINGRKATDYKPDNTMRTSDQLADARSWLHDLMQSQDVDSRYTTEYGDGGHPAALNTGRVDNNSSGASTVTHDNTGKVGRSTPDDPDFLEAYRMWNAQTTHDLVLKKTVTGNLGDLTKEFVYEITLTGLEKGQTYTTDVPAGSTEDEREAGAAPNDVTTPGVKMYDMEPASCLSADGTQFTTDGSGAVAFKVKLRDGDVFVLNALPRMASYRVKEQASDHVPQYNIFSSNKSTERPPVFTEKAHTPGGTDPAHLGKALEEADSELSTELEFVDRYDGTVTIIFRNNRDLSTVTGVAGIDYMVYAAAVALLAALIFILIIRRGRYAEEDGMLV